MVLNVIVLIIAAVIAVISAIFLNKKIIANKQIRSNFSQQLITASIIAIILGVTILLLVLF